ncbi:ABC transporter substrate-binding protein [Celeribacter neptunius]|uniref:ABC-type branched-chain amino acid transport system, substrate-binding protein n=1 Tax=Celeribacter neptunius TaxID=588602 RepID=A0A1I3UFX7_9RHOB|nr:ABC transporter substrate-binding protein [Celeribacter neptunius]SFJ80766.1 ABC-type branched-chain amino acid transport system, substrate-binding protein [Celeribacter neptunius]
MKLKTFAGAICALGTMTQIAVAQDTIKIGAPIPLTGYFAADGQTMKEAVDLAAAHLNANGGVLGRQLEVVTFDIGDLTPDKLTAAAANLIERDEVSVLINGYGGMGPDIPAFCPYGIPYIHNDAVSSVVDLAERMNCGAIFNASDVDVNYGRIVFEQMLASGYDFPSETLALVHGDYEWDINVAKGMAEAAEAAGWAVVYEQEVPYDTVEWTNVVGKLNQTNPGLIHFEALDPSVATTFMSQLALDPVPGAALNIGYIGATPGVDDAIAQGQAEGVFTFTLNAQDSDEVGQAFSEEWSAAYDVEPPVSLAAAVYDMANLWAEAVEEVGDDRNFAAVASEIKAQSFAGIAGTYVFNDRNYISSGTETQPAQLFRIEDGQRVRVVVGDEVVAPVTSAD